eukprot:TRINITY_DN14896_c0_g1_i1.p1 TRINITY_DN14896_c0_g1~~TRINITY_DN14896_c0_g1_i1.p1  ORF type:complete len:695 (+),score=152.38 TRINITY_DN14896_c0_g1_i1:56-2086(+)
MSVSPARTVPVSSPPIRVPVRFSVGSPRRVAPPRLARVHRSPSLSSALSPSPSRPPDGVWSRGSTDRSTWGKASLLHALPAHRESVMIDNKRKVERSRLVDGYLREQSQRRRSESPYSAQSPADRDIYNRMKDEQHFRDVQRDLQRLGASGSPRRERLAGRASTPRSHPRRSSSPWSTSSLGGARSSRPASPALSPDTSRRSRSSSSVRQPESSDEESEPADDAVACISSQWRALIRCLAPATDGAVVWAAGAEGGVSARHSASGDVLCFLPLSDSEVIYGDTLLVTTEFVWAGLSNGFVSAYSLHTSAVVVSSRAHDAAVLHLASDPFSTALRVFSVAADNSVAVWDAPASGPPTLSLRTGACLAYGGLRSAAFVTGIAEMAALWLGFDSGELRAVEVATLAAEKPLSSAAVRGGHAAAVTALATNHRTVYSAGTDGQLLGFERQDATGTWSSAELATRRTLDAGVCITAMVCDVEAARLWTGDSTGAVTVWTTALAPLLTLPQRLDAAVCALCVRHWRRADAVRLWALCPTGAAAWLLARDASGDGAEHALGVLGGGEACTLPGTAEHILGPAPGCVTLRVERHRTCGRVGLWFSSAALVLTSVAVVSPAERSGAGRLIGWTVTHVNGRRVGSVRAARKALRIPDLVVELRFAPPGASPPVSGASKIGSRRSCI